MAFRIYTKTGDKGKTALIGGTKVPKSDLRIDAYGTVDELNSYIGLVSDYLEDKATIALLREIQDRLFTIGASLACDPEKDTKMHIPDLLPADVTLLENNIDKMNDILPEMKAFILPGGHVAVSTCHVARCVCRRAERLCVGLQEQNQFIDPLVLQYMNRLSDYLFVLSRWIGHQLNVPEIAWKPRK
ncbi:MAG TPA: cob(I)yrinic acid a,c-diamide adenosyltransferase [Chitinophaga sp.]|uniref:Corrinoid adenosyltransferase n=1 Tax=Chitinophaga tropicalis TaxID=2683588 RepID=A0A7K1U8U6_9BACT|nr:cob(I)yrinic acid a,c-diamide adenosyltransferase [Chitinophaga tropicalis]MVT10783.1 cob(I)yrinic acid a,c-diamide adenosyltransferase [Chitinophaga tropicalis]HJT74013.1 cob(I)yrinic acid a,c-diamide adenosyltransferase [Chitinophaga sp.]